MAVTSLSERPRTYKEGNITETIGSETKSSDTAQAVKELIETVLADSKAEDITVIGLEGKTNIADYMIIANGRSQRHVSAIAEHIETALKQNGVTGVGVEGRRYADWVLLDAGDVIVHVFRPEVRQFYNLEKMWSVPIPEQAVN